MDGQPIVSFRWRPVCAHGLYAGAEGDDADLAPGQGFEEIVAKLYMSDKSAKVATPATRRWARLLGSSAAPAATGREREAEGSGLVDRGRAALQP